MRNRGINAYRAQNVKHSSNEMIVLRLFEKALVKLWEGHGAITSGQQLNSVEPLQHSRQIFFELLKEHYKLKEYYLYDSSLLRKISINILYILRFFIHKFVYTYIVYGVE